MKNSSLFLFILIIFFSCKHGAEKLDINDIEAHRAYQDSAIAKGKTSDEKILIIKKLVSEYLDLNLKNKDTSSNYHYYVGRAYGNLFDLPFDGVLYDTINNKMYDSSLIYNYLVNGLYYNKLALELHPLNIWAFNVFINILNWEAFYFGINKKGYPVNKNPEKFDNYITYVVSNCLNFDKIDTSENKTKTRFFVENSISLLEEKLFNINSELNDNIPILDDKINIFLQYGELVSYLDKYNSNVVFSRTYYENLKIRLNPSLIKARKLFEENKILKQKIAIEDQFNNINIKHKYSHVNSEAGVLGLLDLYTNSDYTQAFGAYGATKNGFLHGRGTFSRNGHKITFYSTSGISLTGDARLEFSDNKLLIILSTGAVYVEDDAGYYIKNIISTKGLAANLPNSNNDNPQVEQEIADANNSLLIEARNRVEINQSEDFYFKKAWEYVRSEGERSWSAVANFEKAIEINPSKGEYYNDLANCYRGGRKDYKKAIEYYNKAIEKGFNKGFVFYNRAICKVETNELSGACSDNQIANENGWSNDYYNIASKAKCSGQ